MLHAFDHPVATCWVLLAQTVEKTVVKFYMQHLWKSHDIVVVPATILRQGMRTTSICNTQLVP